MIIFPIVQCFFIGIEDFYSITLMILREAFIGCSIGIILSISMSFLHLAGHFISSTSSLSTATLLDPHFNDTPSVISTFLILIGTTAFFMMDFHHIAIESLVKTYDIFPLDHSIPFHDWCDYMTQSVSDIFKKSMQLSFPFLILGTISQLSLGLLNKLIPQIQLFYLMMPIQMMICYGTFFLCINVILKFLIDFIQDRLLLFY
jgi:flagellar biosynthetic protein FliR